jgi:hypothetical protein
MRFSTCLLNGSARAEVEVLESDEEVVVVEVSE